MVHLGPFFFCCVSAGLGAITALNCPVSIWASPNTGRTAAHLMALSKTALRFICVRAEHSTYL
jgi:hypothetical protein